MVTGTKTATLAFVLISQPFGSGDITPEKKKLQIGLPYESFRVVLAKLNIQSYHAF